MLDWIKNKTRLSNAGLWLSLASLVLDVLIFQGKITPTESDFWNSIIQRGLEILVAAGILSNPTNPDGKGYNL